ncbi:MAG: hypothetical protein HN981_04785 [Candidatus Pacebacteria bacterium]|jgi:hypothetical protein|nr:hypothetical protein [Candidatus Paceibacterota bacterium]MBT4652064.1 hypothetical protein [Candidatus Paceibacterota bacterium]MBT6756086.1 hypothetical protein [Candidatus Paceibacterota bacterium]MBT6921679.1 hypothetical protein [Candidatus Paceibacterota bacterium]
MDAWSASVQRRAISDLKENGGTVYEEPYQKKFEGESVLVIGHDGNKYWVISNNQIQLVTTEELF